jgi:hypothetical protein
MAGDSAVAVNCRKARLTYFKSNQAVRLRHRSWHQAGGAAVHRVTSMPA